MKDKAFIGASLVAGIAASLCCILPIVFALAGAGIVGASAFFATWRPYLLGTTFLLLGLGFYFAYRNRSMLANRGRPVRSQRQTRRVVLACGSLRRSYSSLQRSHIIQNPLPGCSSRASPRRRPQPRRVLSEPASQWTAWIAQPVRLLSRRS